ncbi:unnamed protein product [Dovyalis caffra]|uniref:Leucine-rich repeat-containing N-terminal plant-type domain-containing protein n=1 Tax=Dovyalis caffra TaxID=77055 RepID=A0AAV1SD08_9ROSI|nr:unnamed protein product [Dovyalis caffra]
MTRTLQRIFHFLILSSALVVIAAQTEAETLLNWKNSLNVPTLPSWTLNSSSSPCKWTGIRCNEAGSIIEINLKYSGLDGTLDRFDFSSFPNLTSLNLNLNNLVGDIPAGIGNATKLISLDLSSNNFTNPMPPEIGNLKDLQVLRLYNNSLTGPIPHQLSNLQKMWLLDLTANYLKDPDPVQFKGMASLTELRLSYILLEAVPAFIAECPNLIFLDLSDNLITGQIPMPLLSRLKRVEFLNLTKNSVEGPLPTDIGNFRNLRHLRLGMNKLNGTIPFEIGLLSNLEVLELHENGFDGPMPSSVGNLRKLRNLNLRLSGLNSSIPEELGLCTNLTYLELSSNSLIGSLPLSMASLTQIRELGISDNKLSGNIHPSLLSNWSELNSLQLQRNNFSGTVPPQIGTLHQLKLLYLFQNRLSGPVPPEIGNLSNLIELQLANNFFIGSIPPTIGNLSSLTKLSLSYNKLNGTLPPELGKIKSLEELDLSENDLQGTLPSSITGLRNLNLFYVASNNFSGSIPEHFGPDFLRNATFSYNNFSGKLPPGIWHDIPFSNILDERLTPPVGPIVQELVLATALALLCVKENPVSRPTMYQVSSELSASTCLHVPAPLRLLTLQNLMNMLKDQASSLTYYVNGKKQRRTCEDEIRATLSSKERVDDDVITDPKRDINGHVSENMKPSFTGKEEALADVKEELAKPSCLVLKRKGGMQKKLPLKVRWNDQVGKALADHIVEEEEGEEDNVSM